MTQPAIVILDIETSGLDEKADTIFEIGMRILDIHLNEIASWSQIITDDGALQWIQYMERMAKEERDHRGVEPWFSIRRVYEMHMGNGLFSEITNAHSAGQRRTIADVEAEAIQFLTNNFVGPNHQHLPMTGSSILFDRKFITERMPALNKHFHYRNTDISSVKTLTAMYLPHLADKLSATYQPAAKHRSLPDCIDSTEELRFYLTNVVVADTSPSSATS